MIEKWKVIDGFPNYEISNYGNLRVFNTKIGKYVSKYSYIDKDGYIRIVIHKQGVAHYFGVHRLVAMMFIPNPENKPLVNHKNEIKDDNRADNLEWSTHKENTNHGTGIERRAISRGKAVVDTLTGIEYRSMNQAAIEVGISRVSLSRWLNNVYNVESERVRAFKWKENTND